jgi:glycerol-3-phosphate acyltransferase PlsY
MLERVFCLIVGYIFGLFQTAFIYGKLHHIDIREYGSGNAGTTNALRVLGKKAGAITYLGDALKAIVAGCVVRWIFKNQPDMEFIYVLYTGLGVVLGHNFPFYMNFKGGKGIAATSGVVIALFDWKITLIGFIIFVSVAIISKYVSLASLTGISGFALSVIVFSRFDMVKGLVPAHYIEAYILVLIFALFAFIRHKENIQRLINGTERKLGQRER